MVVANESALGDIARRAVGHVVDQFLATTAFAQAFVHEVTIPIFTIYVRFGGYLRKLSTPPRRRM